MSLDSILDGAIRFVPSMLTVLGVIFGLWLANRLLARAPAALSEHRFRIHMSMLALTAVGILIVILVVPIGDARRGQLLSLIGIVLSAAIALSSTTFLGNAMAGIMLRAVGNFRTGDFITCNEHFGRVSERGLFHTEIQTEDRTLTTLPNLLLVTNATTTVRSSGTIVSATASLGYDVAREDVTSALIDAATKTELSDPFVYVMELGDFSITYRVAGLLGDVKSILSARSRLRSEMLDALHGAGIEIVSPNFMNTRALEPDARFVPARAGSAPRERRSEAAQPEAIVFDKADEAETIAQLKSELESVVKQLAKRGESDEDAEVRSELEKRREALEREIAECEVDHDSETGPAGDA